MTLPSLRALLRLPRRLYRAVVVALLLVLAALFAAAVGVSFGRLRPEPLAGWWLRRLHAVLNLDVQWQGERQPEARVVVANHISWLDIAVLGAQLPVRFVSKREVREWPLIGWLAQSAGAFFIRRGSGGAKLLLERLHPHLESGGSVVFFPEGTTTLGDRVLPFRARLFEAAIATGAPVQPVAISYGRDAAEARCAAFIGDDDFLRHLWALLDADRLSVRVRLLPALAPETSRDALAEAARASIGTALAGMAPMPAAIAACTGPESPSRREAEAIH